MLKHDLFDLGQVRFAGHVHLARYLLEVAPPNRAWRHDNQRPRCLGVQVFMRVNAAARDKQALTRPKLVLLSVDRRGCGAFQCRNGLINLFMKVRSR